jgi:hypothetical protein
MRVRNWSIVGFIVLLGSCFMTAPHPVGSTSVRTLVAQQRSDDDRVRAFRRRHRQAEPESQMTLVQAQQMLQTKNYYASLSPRQTYVDGKGYLNFIFPKNSSGGEIDGHNATAHLLDYMDVVEIGIKPRLSGKAYLADCSVKGTGPCYECFFQIQGPDGQGEKWEMYNSEWKDLLFTVNPGDTDWYVLKLQTRREYIFKSCNIMEVP